MSEGETRLLVRLRGLLTSAVKPPEFVLVQVIPRVGDAIVVGMGTDDEAAFEVSWVGIAADEYPSSKKSEIAAYITVLGR